MLILFTCSCGPELEWLAKVPNCSKLYSAVIWQPKMPV